METQIPRVVRLAYSQPESKSSRRHSSDIPGAVFDVTVIVLLLVFATLYFVW